MSVQVSVIITTKNRKNYLSRAISSVRKQTRQADEIIVVDDNSDYDVRASLSHFCSTDFRVIVNDSNLGGAATRNIGANDAKGDILMFLDDDDAWCESKIETQLKLFASGEMGIISMVYSGRLLVSSCAINKVRRRSASKVEGNIYESMLIENHVGVTSAVAINKKIFDYVGGFDENLPCRQDYDLWIRLAKNGAVLWDKNYNVIYTVFDNPKHQISGNYRNHIDAVDYLLNKYSKELNNLSPRKRSEAISEKYFSALKSMRGSSYYLTLKYFCMAFSYSPKFKYLFFLLPRFILKRVGL